MAVETAGEYDVIVLGGGPAGENAASYAIAGSSRTAVIVERELVGGECSYWACMPSKALLRPVEVRAAAQAIPGVPVGALDVAGVLRRRDSFTSHHDDSGQVRWAESEGIDVVRGHGRLAGERLVRVTAADGSTRELRARHAVVLATGSTAVVPPDLAGALPWTSRDVTNLREVPSRVLIIGGGVVACEAATWLAALGAKVVMAVRGSALLAKAEPFAGAAVAASLAADVRFGAVLDSVARPGARDTGEGNIHGGPVEVMLGGERLEFDEVVVAAGRKPATADLGLETVGLAPGRAVATDDHLAAVGEWLYAVGDVNGRSALTHMGKYQARVCGDVIAARADGRGIASRRFSASADHGEVPQVVFTQPQVASVGLTEAQAHAEGLEVEVVAVDIGTVAGAALHADGYSGRAQLLIDRVEDVVIGASFVGPEVAELVHAATIAVVGRVPVDLLWHAVPAYPTVSEVWLRLLEARRG
ncbi:dihydrolipoyl dehydrogenase family protein [Tomitella biformata]|uniref:dihydrolipoyl dehydrogenase family protein n=1 Tax=Tomitella biformata TaxID=630403 RepID=UPI0004B3FFAE|nr:NAD(P)/FAD-dependent oxidoreductase [Tomitella biformata]